MQTFKIFGASLVMLVFMQCTPVDNKVEHTNAQKEPTLTPVPFNQVQLNDNFWKPRLITQAETLVPFALDKTIPAVENLEKAAKFLKGDSTDLPFAHRYISSDLYKVMEGAAYLLMGNKNPALEQRMDSIINIIASAQEEDGYLYVAHITGVSKEHDHWGGGGIGDKPYSFVLHSHELYNMGHMYEAAIAYYLATGKDKWLTVAEKNAKHINKVFFEGDPEYNNGKPVNQAPDHQELELALSKLYRVTGNKLYLEMAKKFLDIRGKTFIPEGDGVMSPTYAQQHKPVVDQKTAVGHAVRAAYMYSAMADVGALTGTAEYDQALNSIWRNIVDTKMHITGGLGAVHGIEGFGPEYVLPNKEAYNETCAAVGNVLFNFRMFLLTKDAKFMDVAEISLLNNALAGVNLEGNEFFYVNPLEVELLLPMVVRFNKAHEKIKADENRIALTRGPLVYCAEGVDNDGPVQRFLLEEIPRSAEITTARIKEGVLKNIVAVKFHMNDLADSERAEAPVQFIPYYAWNNRGDEAMMVWFPTREEQIQEVGDDMPGVGKL